MYEIRGNCPYRDLWDSFRLRKVMKPHNRHRKLFVLHKDHFKLFELPEGPSGGINGAPPAAYCGLMVPIWS